MRPASFLPACLALSLVLAGFSAAADNSPDWPRFRGPGQNNLSPDIGLLKEWPKEGPPVVWKATGIGSGYSSITIAGTRIYTMGNKDRVSYVFAIDRDNGKVIWSAKVGRPGGNLGCTPTVDGDRVYAIGQEGDLVCLDASDGTEKWRKDFKKDFGGNYGGWRYTESPLVDDDKLVCTPGGKNAVMVALDKKSGEVLWKCPAPPRTSHQAGYSSPVVAEVGGVRQYVQLVAAGVIGVSAKDGKLLWKYDKLGNNTANIPTPTVLGDHIFCAAGYGKGAALLKLTARDGEVSAKELYYNFRMRNKHGGLVVVGEYVYGDEDDKGMPFCAEVKTGKVLWQKKDRGAGQGSACVTYADGHLYFVYQNGVVALVEASPKEYREVSTFRIPRAQGYSWAHPVVLGGRLYVRQDGTLWCHDVKQR
jgi:outer membrane protein assembly factor BamB